jgi:hypothetical protein
MFFCLQKTPNSPGKKNVQNLQLNWNRKCFYRNLLNVHQLDIQKLIFKMANLFSAIKKSMFYQRTVVIII